MARPFRVNGGRVARENGGRGRGAGAGCEGGGGVRGRTAGGGRGRGGYDGDDVSDRYRALAERLGGERLERAVPLAPLTTFKIGGPADVLYRARTVDELVAAITAVRELELPHFLLGAGANILVGDRGFRGVVIRCEVAGIEFSDGNRVRAGAGELVFPDLIVATVSRGLGGLHHYVGIPSTVGGAIWQNLHFLSPPPERARTCFIEEVFEAATILTAEGELRTADRDYFRFGYDYSILHERDDIVLDVTFRLDEQPEPELRHVMRENLKWRDERHPDLWLYPCAGSIFQKIEGIGAGRLVDQCGLKGHIIGNAQIFHKHANIIVNLGGATAADVCALIDLAQRTVRRELGHELRAEIGLIGEF
jgi:UDP-N-acetylmuramate dehydrogenase